MDIDLNDLKDHKKRANLKARLHQELIGLEKQLHDIRAAIAACDAFEPVTYRSGHCQ